MFRNFGPPEILLILLIVVLLFGAKKLPETARGLGKSLRIFKAETKALKDDDVAATDTDAVAPREVEARREVSEPVNDTVRDGVADPSRRDA